jgi:EpsI family protein
MNLHASRQRVVAILPYGVLLAMLLLAFVVIRKTTDVSAEALAGLSLELPGRIGDWVGTPVAVQPIERKYLGEDTLFARKIYRHPDGREVFLGIVLSGRDRSSIHAAEACLVGQGWTLSNGGIFSVPMLQPKPYTLETMRLTITRQISPQASATLSEWYIYWFVGHNRLTARHLNRIVWTAWDRIFHNVNHRWAYVTVDIPAPPGREAETQKIVIEFMQQAIPTFQKVTG